MRTRMPLASAARPAGMRRAGAVAIALLAAVLPVSRAGADGAAVAAAGVPLAAADPACGTVMFVLREGTVAYRLPQPFVRPGSDSVWTRAAVWQRGNEYALDETRGELRLLRQPAPGETLWVHSCRLLVPPPLEYQLYSWRPVAPGGSGGGSGGGRSGGAAPAESAAAAVPLQPQARPATARSTATAPAGTELTLTGNKSIAVDFGSSQDAFLRQSLDLAVTGTLAPGVELTGVLSDRNTPLGVSGATQDLQSLDRVLIELKAPQGSAALGDVSLGLTHGEFSRLERRLQGVRGEWSGRGFTGVVAAANAQGEHRTLQFYGQDGRQGPYQLTDGNGNPLISVVAGSEGVTLDGVRLTRGESADYFMDYDRGRVTFTNRRPISSASRITVDYQFSVNRFRRNFAAGGASWERARLRASTTFVTEGDDRGRPLGAALDAGDRLALAAAGDSASLAVGSGVTPGVGDYAFVPPGAAPAHYQFVGVDSGAFAVQFTRVGPGLGAYVDSSVVSGRVVFAFVGQGNGAFRIGRALPLADSHQLWAMTAGANRGPLTVDVEGAVSRHDLNTFSTFDDGDNVGGAGRARMTLAGRIPGGVGGMGGLELLARGVGRKFAAFGRLERPFEQEDWGLPVSADLERQQRYEVSGYLKPRLGGELRAMVGHLETPDQFRSLRGSVQWAREGTVTTRAGWERADGHQTGLAFPDGGRNRAAAELGLRLKWLEPVARGEWDQRRTPSDTGRVGIQTAEIGGDLRSPQSRSWHALVGGSVRDESRDGPTGFVAQNRARIVRAAIETPASAPWGASLAWQRRRIDPRADPRRSRSDLGSARLRAGDPVRGWNTLLGLEITSEGENRQVRRLVFVGTGNGAYDGLGNPVTNGDYDLIVETTADLDPVARSATSARAAWQFGHSETWRGSRLEASFESEARRRGELHAHDAILSPGMALGDTGLARGAVTQRIETELAPGSRAAAFRLRFERRVSGDRSFSNFAQTLDQRSATLRWLSRPAPALSAEVEGRLRRDDAGQALLSGSTYTRSLRETGAMGQLVLAPDPRVRAAVQVDAGWSRPADGSVAPTRTLQIGPDLGLALGRRGHLDLSTRRAFVSGPPALSLLPSVDPAGAPRWQGTARADYRVHETTTFSTSFTVRDRTGQVAAGRRATEMTGRAELRAFF